VIAPVLAAAALALGAPPADATPASVRGVYRLSGTAVIDVRPAFHREVEARADAVLDPGRGPRDLRLRVAAQGHACELAARLEPDGAVTLEPGQRCAVEVRDPEARGRLDLRLRSGRGRVDPARDRLALELAFDVSGALSLRASVGAQVFGVDLGDAWMPEVPASGVARATAEGGRDHSRAGSR
jgi:hypothetical protein